MCSEADCVMVAALCGLCLLRSLHFSFVFMYHAKKTLRVRAFWHMMLCVWAIASCRFEGSWCLDRQRLSSPRYIILEDEGTMILRNGGKYTTYTASRSPLWVLESGDTLKYFSSKYLVGGKRDVPPTAWRRERKQGNCWEQYSAHRHTKVIRWEAAAALYLNKNIVFCKQSNTSVLCRISSGDHSPAPAEGLSMWGLWSFRYHGEIFCPRIAVLGYYRQGLLPGHLRPLYRGTRSASPDVGKMLTWLTGHSVCVCVCMRCMWYVCHYKSVVFWHTR